MDVAAWLRDLGLERYVSAFRDNDIDAEVLPKLTAEDLISIGVTSVGHRRKLLEAIAGLGTAVPTAVVGAPAPGAPLLPFSCFPRVLCPSPRGQPFFWIGSGPI